MHENEEVSMSLKGQIEQSYQASVEGMDIPWMLGQWVANTPD